MSSTVRLRCLTHDVNAHEFGSSGPGPILRLIQNLEHINALIDADPDFYISHDGFENQAKSSWIDEFLQLHRNCELGAVDDGRIWRKHESLPAPYTREGRPILSKFEGL